MATSTLLQKLDGGSDFGASTSARRQVEVFIANGTVAAGDVVAFDTSKTGADRVLYVTKAALVPNGNGLCCGVALHAATAGENLKTVIAGYAESVTSNGAMAIGNILTASGAVAGEVDGRIAADISAAFGVALEAGANPDCWIYKQF
tara:strand:+ start:243 stop:683 length:441 start_codon:yes stop_codon:yes gene_type:complete